MAQGTALIQDRLKPLIASASAKARGPTSPGPKDYRRSEPRRANPVRSVQLAGCALLLLLLTACAPTTLAVSDIYSMPGSIGQVCAAYFTIDNPTDQADVLIGAQSDVAESIEIHAMTIDAGGHMAMEQQASVTVPARAKVEFKPGGLHLMITNLKRDVKTGDSFQLTLQFQNRGAITIQVTVDL